MSRQNVELVERMYEAFSRGDAAAALSYFDPEVVMDASHRVDGRIGHGHQELTAILIEWLGTWDGWREEVEETRDLGDRVLVISSPTRCRQGKRDRVGEPLRDALRDAERQDHSLDNLRRSEQGPRSRGAAGVGDLAAIQLPLSPALTPTAASLSRRWLVEVAPS
jgi:ketosteroid isomerase-like protein